MKQKKKSFFFLWRYLKRIKHKRRQYLFLLVIRQHFRNFKIITSDSNYSGKKIYLEKLSLFYTKIVTKFMIGKTPKLFFSI